MSKITQPIDAQRLSLILNDLRLPAIKLSWPAIAERADKEGRPAARFLEIARDEEDCAREAGAAPASPADHPSSGVGDGLRLVEEAFERYADIAASAQNEAILSEAQRLAARAVRRLAALGRPSTH